MENVKIPSPDRYTDVRFNRIYSIFMLLAGIAFVIWALSPGRDAFAKYYFLFLALIFFIHGLYTFLGKKYIRYNPSEKKICFYNFWIIDRRVKYDTLFFRGKDLYRVINGKIRFINVIRSQCNKKDLDVFFQEIRKDPFFTGTN
jgi:hypothetical protein